MASPVVRPVLCVQYLLMHHAFGSHGNRKRPESTHTRDNPSRTFTETVRDTSSCGRAHLPPLRTLRGGVPVQRFSGPERGQEKAPRIASQASVVGGEARLGPHRIRAEKKKLAYVFTRNVFVQYIAFPTSHLPHVQREGATFLHVANRNDKEAVRKVSRPRRWRR